ncbi:MAG: ATP synthase F1 subunit delta [Flavobacteriales bacterium]|nr:ATP synthase F1 subunit delta [Flavobacteriales bacterium]
MLDSKVASRYAKSLIDLGKEQNALETLIKDMILIKDVCNENPDFITLLKSPVIRGDKKQAIIKEVFYNSFSSEVTKAFVEIILRKKREAILYAIAVSFISLYKEHHNIKIVKVTTAVPLSVEQKQSIIAQINKTEKATIELEEVVNKDIIGGLILRIEDKQLDESIRRKLLNLEMEFDDNPYVKEF